MGATLPQTAIEKQIISVTEQWTAFLDTAFRMEFEIEIETRFDLLSGQYITQRVDRAMLSPDHASWIGAYADGYNAATRQLRLLCGE